MIHNQPMQEDGMVWIGYWLLNYWLLNGSFEISKGTQVDPEYSFMAFTNPMKWHNFMRLRWMHGQEIQNGILFLAVSSGLCSGYYAMEFYYVS